MIVCLLNLCFARLVLIMLSEKPTRLCMNWPGMLEKFIHNVSWLEEIPEFLTNQVAEEQAVEGTAQD